MRIGQIQIACPPLSHFREYKDQVFPPKIAIEVSIYIDQEGGGDSPMLIVSTWEKKDEAMVLVLHSNKHASAGRCVGGY